ncbi:MAG: hypothetical protein JO031_00270, partial [Ktedonobacteraceae bacterium]|nr:hypothetical protein [Ktedonobacteraceae bacterium]
MSQKRIYKNAVSLLTLCTLIVSCLSILVVGSPVSHAQTTPTTTTKDAFCSRLGKNIEASSGAQMFCFGPQPSTSATKNVKKILKSSFGTNVDAANPNEDIAPSGVRAYGQSEVSVASIDSYTVEAWNDATSFSAPCPSPQSKEEGTGFGFSANGGKSFTDLGGLPNTACNAARYQGDPSVETWRSGGSDYFYISSLFNPVVVSALPSLSYLALSACKVHGSGTTASLTCSQPIIAAASTECSLTLRACSFLDKDFLSIDPVRGRLYLSYTEFGIGTNPTLTNGAIELAACDIGTSAGGKGPQGGTPAAPVCLPGNTGTATALAHPYFIVSPSDATCEQEGAYPAVDAKTGAVYVAYEYNWSSNLFSPPCFSKPTQNVVKYVPGSCLTLPVASCKTAAASNAVNIVSMDGAFVPGYSRFPMNDFPRIAVSAKSGTVSIVWNDARLHPAGDILLQSYEPGNLKAVQPAPLRVNSSTGGWHLLPALRNADTNGNLNISFYGRTSPNTAVTDVYAALNVNPRTRSSVTGNTLITTTPTNWLAVSSIINPNFGDYTDAYVIATTGNTYTGKTV